MATIEELLAQLGAMQYEAPTMKSYQSGYTPVDRSLPDWKPAGFKQSDFGSLAKDDKKKGGINIWDVISGTLGQSSGLTTNAAYNSVSKLMDDDVPLWKKVFTALNPISESLGQGIENGGKQQWKNWTDGKLSWGDVPGVGFLHGADKGWKRGYDIQKDILGVDSTMGKVAGGIAWDIALDPLTYATGGLSVASKAKKAAEATEMVNQAKKIGSSHTVFVNEKHFLESMEGRLRLKYRKYPNLEDKMVAKKMDEIMNNVKSAGAKAFDANTNKSGFGIPFTNKNVLGDTPKWSPLYRTEAAVSSTVLNDLLGKASMGDGSLQRVMEEVAKVRYGIDDISKLTKSQYSNLHDELSPLIERIANRTAAPDVRVTQSVVEKAMPQADFDRLMTAFENQNIPWKDVQKQLDGFMSVIGKDPALRSTAGKMMAQKIADFWAKKAKRKNAAATHAPKAQSMAWASQFLGDSANYKTVKTNVTDVFPKGSPEALAAKDASDISKTVNSLLDNKYTGLNNAKTKFEHWLDKRNPFDSRTLATGNKFLDSMGDHISDAHSQRIGENAMFTKALSQVEKFVKKHGNDEDMMKEAIYHLEGKAPDSLGKGWQPSRAAKQLANLIRPLLDDVAENEMGGQVLNNLRQNYFPHVLNKTESDIKEIQDFIKRHPEYGKLSGLSSGNNFNKSRNTFQTMADKDNYIHKLQKAIQKETDSDKLEVLRKQQELVADLFDTNVVTALNRRVREGVRAKAMKAMQGELSKYGMMKTIKKGSGEAPPEGTKLIEPAEAKKLGLGEGSHYVNPQVLEAMKRVDEVFTDQNMNKISRGVAAIGDIWRPLVTYYKPAHYINNMIGNTINNIAAGVNPKEVIQAGSLLRKYRSGKLSSDEQKIIKAAYKHNVISGGFLFDSRATFEFDNPTALEKAADWLGNNKGIKKVRNAGEIIDDVSRLANFLNGMNKFGTTEKAAQQVRKYLFNYNELTNADRGMRVLVPFWNWTKRNIPLQLQVAMENPKHVLNVERFKDLFNQDREGQDWQKESGIKVSDNYYTSLPSPTNDLGMLVNPRSLLSSTTPAIKMPLEMTMNKKMYTGKPISYGSDNVQSEDMLNYIMSNLGVGNNAYQAATSDKTTFENIMGMLKPVSRINPTE